MSDLARWFQEGGAGMYAILLLDVLGLFGVGLSWIVALWGRLRGRSSALVRLVPALVMLGAALPALVGAISTFQAHVAVRAAVRFAEPAQRDALLAQGLAEALVPLRFGGGSTVLLGGLAVLALMIAPWGAKRG
jgi:hypothetical protein